VPLIMNHDVGHNESLRNVFMYLFRIIWAMNESSDEDILKIIKESKESKEKPTEPPQTKVYKCKRCGKEFTSRSEYNRHIWEHTKAERAAGEEKKESEEKTEILKFDEENKPVITVSPWDRIKWFVVGGLVLLALYIVFLYWRKRGRKEPGGDES